MMRPDSKPIVEGAPVHITDGPFKNHDAVCVRSRLQRGAIRVLLIAYNREIEVDVMMVEGV